MKIMRELFFDSSKLFKETQLLMLPELYHTSYHILIIPSKYLSTIVINMQLTTI